MSTQQYDPEQVRLMAEEVILVDYQDKKIKSESKRVSHKMVNLKKGMLHRAFSVFLFNEKNELLLQQRSDEKITFPSCWTNTCCSHPLWREGEVEQEDVLEQKVTGAKNAARRKLDHELGIPEDTFTNDDLKFLGRIHYIADQGDEWGEHEIDYIFFLKGNVSLDNVNRNEIRDEKYVTAQQLKDMVAKGENISPWCKLIIEKGDFIFERWEDLDNIVAGNYTPDNGIRVLNEVPADPEKKLE